MSRRLVLLRHGRTSWNAEGRFQGQSDPPLDEVGLRNRREAAALVAALHPDLIVSSDAVRAAQTAAPLARITGLDVVHDARLRERSLGAWEGLTREEVEQRFPEQYARWAAGHEIERPGGESRAQVAERALSVLTELPDVDVTVVVTHSATAMAVSAALLGLSQSMRLLAPLANCHWTELRAEPTATTRWRLRAHNIGPAGPVVPIPVRIEDAADDDFAPDASA